MRYLPILWLALALAACTGGGGIGPFTNPMSYLRDYPLGESQDDVLRRMGAPSATVAIDGGEAWTYWVSRNPTGNRYSFFFRQGRVYDVQYNDEGPYNGTTARTLQGLATASPDRFPGERP